MTILLTNPTRTAAAKTTIRMRKPHQITQTLIAWHFTTHTGTFTGCQEDVCVLIDDFRSKHECTCTPAKPGSGSQWDNKTCLTCNDDLWLGAIDPETILAAVRRIHEDDDHADAHLFCEVEPCFSIERADFVAGCTSAPKLRR